MIKWDTCAERKSCFNCSALTGCHWCASDNKCHAYGSPYGCTVGISCKDAAECLRTEPVHIGVRRQRAGVMFAVISVGLVLLAICYGIVGYCTASIEARRRHQLHSVQVLSGSVMHVNDDATDYRKKTPLPAAKSQIRDDYVLLRDAATRDEERNANIDRCCGLYRCAYTCQDACTTSAECVKCFCYWGSCCNCCGTGCGPYKTTHKGGCVLFGVLATVAIVGAMVSLILLVPQAPEYSACTTTVEWTSALTNLAKGLDVKARVEVHLALYNPNRLELHVRRAFAEVYYSGHRVGAGDLRVPVTFPEGSVVDVISVLDFEPGMTRAVQMLVDHESGRLLLDVNLSLEADILAYNQRLLSVNTTHEISRIDVSVPDDRRYCKCH